MNTRFILLGLLSLLPLASQVSVFAERAIDPDDLGNLPARRSTESLGFDSKPGSQDSSQGKIYKTKADLMNEFLGMDPSQVDEYVRRHVESCKKSPTFDWMDDTKRLESLKVTVELAIEVKFGLHKAPSNDVLQKIIKDLKLIEAKDPKHEKEYKEYAAFANYYAALSILTEMQKSNRSIIEAATAVGTGLGLLQEDVDRLFKDATLFLRAVKADELMNKDANELLSEIRRMPVTISYDSEPAQKKAKLDTDSVIEESENDIQEIDTSMSVELPSSDAEDVELPEVEPQESEDIEMTEDADDNASDVSKNSELEFRDADQDDTASEPLQKKAKLDTDRVTEEAEQTPTDTKQDLNRDDSVYPSGDDSAAKEDTEGLRQPVTGIKIEPTVDALAILGGSATSDESAVLMKKNLTEIRNRSMNGPKIETFKGSLESALNREYSRNGYKSRPCVINPTNGVDRSLYDCLPGLNDGLRSVAAGDPRHKFGLYSTLPLRGTFFPVNVLSHVSIDDPALLVYWTVAFAIMSESNVLIIDKQGWNLSGVNPDVFGTLLKKVLKDPTIVNLLDRIVLVNNENLTPSVQR